MNHYIKATTAVVSLLALTSLSSYAAAGDPKDKPFNEHSWIMTHNSYEKINQNLAELPRQMRDGVRGFMLDLYLNSQTGRPSEVIRVCHGTPGGQFCYGPLVNQLNNEISPFLANNPNEVVMLLMEDYVEAKHYQQVLEAAPDLAKFSFNPANFSGPQWPTLREMIDKNNRLIILTNKKANAKDYKIGDKTVTVLYEKDWLASNKWDTLGLLSVNHNWTCPLNYGDQPNTKLVVGESTQKTWSRLFLMNQFHGATSTIFDSAAKDNNLTYLMRRAETCGHKPNFIGVNNYQSGDLKNYTHALTNGGIYFYEGANADPKQDAVCVIPSTQGNVNLKANGCENDEARSLSLSGVSKGTRITLYDNAAGHTDDDHLIIDVKRDIGLKEKVILPSFQVDLDNNDFKTVYNRNNGIDGKLSRVTISQTPSGFSDASILFYEGNDAKENLDCTIPFTSTYIVKMKNNSFGCSNDEISSAKIVKAKAGSSLSLYGHPDGKNNQGVTTIEILKDIKSPQIIPSFDRSFTNQYVRVINYHEKIDGKISFGGIRGTR